MIDRVRKPRSRGEHHFAQRQRGGQTVVGFLVQQIGTRRLGPMDQKIVGTQAAASEVAIAKLMQSSHHVDAALVQQVDREPTAGLTIGDDKIAKQQQRQEFSEQGRLDRVFAGVRSQLQATIAVASESNATRDKSESPSPRTSRGLNQLRDYVHRAKLRDVLEMRAGCTGEVATYWRPCCVCGFALMRRLETQRLTVSRRRDGLCHFTYDVIDSAMPPLS